MADGKVWTIEVAFREDDEHTRAAALLVLDEKEVRAEGHARRHPEDPQVPRIGEQIAAARALSALAHELLDDAAHGIEAWEHHPVKLPI
jgi:hypothetical protein